ncbi:MAG: ABC transporter permease [Cyclobacteriaceae bacterium]
MDKNSGQSPPRWLLSFLRWFCKEELLEDVEGDLLELHSQRSDESRKRADILFTRDVLLLLRPGIMRNIQFNNSQNNNAMIKNYLKVALRNALRYKGYTTINLMGLIVGLVSVLMIALWVADEYKVDSFHSKGDRTYMVWRNMYQSNGDISTTPFVPNPVKEVLSEEFPEIESLAATSWTMDAKFEVGQQILTEEGIYATSGLFEVFDFKWRSGNTKAVFDNRSSIAISERMAAKLYGDNWSKETVLGKTLTLQGEGELVIGGVFENPPENSTIDFDWLISYDRFESKNEWVQKWDSGAIRLYFSLRNNADLPAVADRILPVINNHSPDPVDERLMLQKFSDSYLYSKIDNGAIAGGRIDYVRIMVVVAVFILLIICMNFTNLVTARSGRRAKEVGVRKVMGAGKKSLSLQFFTESVLTSLVAMVISVVLVMILLPYFNLLTDKSMVLPYGSLSIWLALVGLATIIGLISGLYPALLLPAGKIITSLKGKNRHGRQSVLFRKGLVVFQFAISMLLIAGTFVIYSQLQFILTKDIGLDKENVVLVDVIGGDEQSSRFDLYKTELLKKPEVVSVSGANGNPISYGNSTGSAQWEGKDPSVNAEIGILLINDDFTETLKMEVLSGRSLSGEYGTDTLMYMVNEQAAELMGFADPIDKSLSVWGRQGRIVGLVKDFHMTDMYEPIGPLIIGYIPAASRVALVRVQGEVNQALTAIESVVTALNPKEPFRFQLLSDTYANSYESERVVSKLAGIFTFISLFISCLGLFALSAFSAEQRAKEIGVRKVHGAGVWQIMILLTRDYAGLILLAIVLATPLAWYYAGQWLTEFAYRMQLDPFIFLATGITLFLIGLMTVSFKSYHAATVNPIKSLKDE